MWVLLSWIAACAYTRSISLVMELTVEIFSYVDIQNLKPEMCLANWV